VDVHAERELVSARSEVRNIEHKVLGQLALHAEAPLVDVSRLEVRVDARRHDARIAGEGVGHIGQWANGGGEWTGGLPVAERRIARQRRNAVADDLVVVERSEARADDGLCVVERAISDADARREIVLVGLPQPPTDTRAVTQQQYTVADI